MAEARQAVGFRLGITPEGGIDFEIDHDVFDLMFKAFKRSWTKSTARLWTRLKTGIFPVKLELFSVHVTVLFALHLAGVDPTFGITHSLVEWFNM